MKQTNVGKLISILVLSVLVFLATGVVFAQGPPRGTPEARALDLMDLFRASDLVLSASNCEM